MQHEMQDQSHLPLFETDGKVNACTFQHFSVVLLQMSFCLSNLMLTGCATPYLQNGGVYN